MKSITPISRIYASWDQLPLWPLSAVVVCPANPDMPMDLEHRHQTHDEVGRFIDELA